MFVLVLILLVLVRLPDELDVLSAILSAALFLKIFISP